MQAERASTGATNARRELAKDRHKARPALFDTDFAITLEGFSNDTGVLCDTCKQIGITERFQWFSLKNSFDISLNDALQGASKCSFCDVVATAASKREALLEAAKRERIDCVVNSQQLNTRDTRRYPQ